MWPFPKQEQPLFTEGTYFPEITKKNTTFYTTNPFLFITKKRKEGALYLWDVDLLLWVNLQVAKEVTNTMRSLEKRIENLEQEVYGAVQETIIIPKTDSCTWDLKDHIHVTSCRKTMLLSNYLVHNVEELNYCPYCGRSIKVTP